jgi:hypothetical protein
MEKLNHIIRPSHDLSYPPFPFRMTVIILTLALISFSLTTWRPALRRTVRRLRRLPPSPFFGLCLRFSDGHQTPGTFRGLKAEGLGFCERHRVRV